MSRWNDQEKGGMAGALGKNPEGGLGEMIEDETEARFREQEFNREEKK